MEKSFDKKKYDNEYSKEHYKQFKVKLKNEEKEELDKLLDQENITKAQFLRNSIYDFKEELKMKFLEKRNEEKEKEVEVDTNKYDVLYFKNKKLENLGFGSIDTNYNYISLNNKSEIENYVFKMINEFDISCDKGCNFALFLNADDVIYIINNKSISLLEILKQVFSKKINSYFELQKELINIFLKHKNI